MIPQYTANILHVILQSIAAVHSLSDWLLISLCLVTMPSATHLHVFLFSNWVNLCNTENTHIRNGWRRFRSVWLFGNVSWSLNLFLRICWLWCYCYYR